MDDFQLAAMMLTAAVGRPAADDRRLTTRLQSVGGRAAERAHNPVYLGTKAKIQKKLIIMIIIIYRAATCSDFSEMLRFLMACPTNRPT